MERFNIGYLVETHIGNDPAPAVSIASQMVNFPSGGAIPLSANVFHGGYGLNPGDDPVAINQSILFTADAAPGSVPAPAFPGWAMGALSVLLIGSASWMLARRRQGAA